MIKKSYEIEKELEKHFASFSKESRFNHSKSVAQMACYLNEIHNLGLDEEKIRLCGLLHDYAKAFPLEIQEKYLIEQVNEGIIKANLEELKKAPLIWHGFICPTLIHEKFQIVDKEIDDAIFYHTTGKPAMSDLTKIIFLSDYIEPTRTFEEAAVVREIAYKSLDDAVESCLEKTIDHLKQTNQFIYPLTLETYNYYKNRRK